MTKAEAPQFEGRLDNPDWTSIENNELEKSVDTQMGAEAARRVLGLDKSTPKPERKPKPVYGSIQREIADSDARVQTEREKTTGGGEILDMEPDKRAHDLEQLRAVRESLEKPKQSDGQT